MSATVEVASLRMEEVSTLSRLTLVDRFKQGILSSGFKPDLFKCSDLKSQIRGIHDVRDDQAKTPNRRVRHQGDRNGRHQGRYRAVRSPLPISSPAGRSDLLRILAEGLERQHDGVGRAEREREVDGDQSVAEILQSGCGGSVGGRRGFEEVSVEVH
ncbi:hypothetical protein U1Q18_049945 [Sarracenia purpurea var. burkii]